MINNIIPELEQTEESMNKRDDYFGEKYRGTRLGCSDLSDDQLLSHIVNYMAELSEISLKYNRLLSIGLAFEHELKERKK